MNPQRRRWTPEEDAILTRNWARVGVKGTTRLLHEHGYNRTESGVSSRATRLKLDASYVNGYVPACWLLTSRGATLYTIVRAAERDGALRRNNGPVKYLVREEWADQYAEKIEEWQKNRELIGLWWTYEDIAKRLGIHVRSAHRAVTTKTSRLHEFFRDVEWRYAHTNRRRRIFHPQQAERALRQYLRTEAAA